MTDEQRQQVFDALLGDVSALPPGDLARTALEHLALAELNELEPIIDRFIAEARAERRAA